MSIAAARSARPATSAKHATTATTAIAVSASEINARKNRVLKWDAATTHGATHRRASVNRVTTIQKMAPKQTSIAADHVAAAAKKAKPAAPTTTAFRTHVAMGDARAIPVSRHRRHR